jgi:ectoine hydroxylase-related dioxygenase (phytanoyl-CoA dioxygenase family)
VKKPSLGVADEATGAAHISADVGRSARSSLDAAAYGVEGHVTVPGLLAADELTEYRAIVAEVCAASKQRAVAMDQRNRYQQAFVQEMNLWQRRADIRPLVFDARLAAAAAALLGVERVRIYHDQALSKEPFGGGTPWHVDQQYWPLDTDQTVTAWIPLQDVSIAMGPLRFARASHQIDAGRDLAISDSSDELLSSEIRRRRLQISEAPFSCGDVSFHAGWTFHGSAANTTDRWRHVMTVIYVADGARLAEPTRDEQRFDRRMWLPNSVVGEQIDSWLNPVIEGGVLDCLPAPAPMVGTFPLDGFVAPPT